MKILKHIFTFFISYILMLSIVNAAEYSYQNQRDWQYLHSVCSAGKNQSPIDLSVAKEGKSSFILNNTSIAKPYSISKTINSINVYFSGDYNPTIRFNSVDYYAYAWQIHAPSEHVVGEVSYAMESQIIFKNTTGGTVILASFFVEGQENHSIDTIIKGMPTDNQQLKFNSIISIDDLLPTNLLSFYYYTGSFTTPNESEACAENVNWFVLINTITASKQQIANINLLFNGLPNNRTIQRHNGRDIFFSK